MSLTDCCFVPVFRLFSLFRLSVFLTTTIRRHT